MGIGLELVGLNVQTGNRLITLPTTIITFKSAGKTQRTIVKRKEAIWRAFIPKKKTRLFSASSQSSLQFDGLVQAEIATQRWYALTLGHGVMVPHLTSSHRSTRNRLVDSRDAKQIQASKDAVPQEWIVFG